MRIDDIGRASPREQFADPPAILLAQGLYADARQDARKIGLLAAIAPDQTDHRDAGPQRRAQLLKHAQLGTYRAVATVNGDQRAGVEYRLHATSGREARPSRDAAASSRARPPPGPVSGAPPDRPPPPGARAEAERVVSGGRGR